MSKKLFNNISKSSNSAHIRSDKGNSLYKPSVGFNKRFYSTNEYIHLVEDSSITKIYFSFEAYKLIASFSVLGLNLLNNIVSRELGPRECKCTSFFRIGESMVPAPYMYPILTSVNSQKELDIVFSLYKDMSAIFSSYEYLYVTKDTYEVIILYIILDETIDDE